ncbi:MAG TPA: acyl carrier protein [Clostridiaceae bacterium]|jgi:acyl carrier protein|nr:acyl carrier protein [Clostridiaceae bacterium]
MSGDPIFESVKSILVEQLGVEGDSVAIDSSLIDDLNADSLDMVELVMAMEQEFGISIPDEEAERIKTVGDAVEFIKANS